MAKIAINGMGRIGRSLLKQLLTIDFRNSRVPKVYKQGCENSEVVVVRDTNLTIGDLCYLLNYETHNFYGQAFQAKCNGQPSLTFSPSGTTTIQTNQGHLIAFISTSAIPNWSDYGVSVLIDCSGAPYKELQAHANSEVDFVWACGFTDGSKAPIVVPGINSKDALTNKIVGLGSCSMNAAAYLLQSIIEAVGRPESAHINIFRSYTNDQPVTDGFAYNKGSNYLERMRAAAENIVPTYTSAANLKYAMPELNGVVSASAFRAPISLGGCLSITLNFTSSKPTKVIEEALFLRLPGRFPLCTVTKDKIVSSDVVGSIYSVVATPTYNTQVGTGTASTNHTIVALYDNENGYAAQIIALLGELAL